MERKKGYLRIILFSSLLLFIFLGFWGFYQRQPDPPPLQKIDELKPLLEPVVFPNGKTIYVETADTFAKRRLGLMFRKNLPPDRGMLFFYPEPGSHRIWMKNCFIALDLLWINAKKEVIEIKEYAPPCKKDPCPVYGTNTEALYVLEVPAGTVADQELSVGSKIHFKEMRGSP